MSKRSHEEAFEPDQMLAHIRQLRREAGGAEEFTQALSTVSTLICNCLEHPEEPRYRTIRLANSSFYLRLGRFGSGIALLRAAGFEDAYGDDSTAAGPPTHLALPVADAPILAQTVVLLAAASEAAASVDGPSAAAASAAPVAALGRAEGKRKMADAECGAGAGAAPGGASIGSSSSAPEPAGPGAEEAVEELCDYSCAGIGAYFQTIAGEAGDGLASLTPLVFDRLAATARDAAAVASSTGDAVAAAAAEGWLETLREHGAYVGWVEEAAEDVGSEGEGEEGRAPADAGGVAVLGDDGNLDSCAVCGGAGELICCDGCPMAFHIDCLPQAMRPSEEEDDESEWLCASCRK